MAAMNATDCQAAGALFQSDATPLRETFGAFTKADIQTAVVAVDAWAVANAASYNAALPLATRSGLTTAQKSRLLMYVLRKRYETGA